jgi:putative heme-binding domain-containing protein
MVELKGGDTKAGFVAARSDDALTLKMAGGIIEKIPSAHIARTNAVGISSMPEGLLQGFTAQEAADLLEFLTSLK